MKRITHHTVEVNTDEVVEYADVFGKPFGESHDDYQTFNLADGQQAICVGFDTPGHTESALKFFKHSGGLYTPSELVLSTEPYGAGEVLDQSSYEAIDMFVNDKDEHPAGPRYTTRYKWVGGRPTIEKVEIDAGTWLKPHSRYYITMQFLQNSRAPMSLYARATDGDETELAAAAVESPQTGFEIDLGPLGRGTFTPYK